MNEIFERFPTILQNFKRWFFPAPSISDETFTSFFVCIMSIKVILKIHMGTYKNVRELWLSTNYSILVELIRDQFLSFPGSQCSKLWRMIGSWFLQLNNKNWSPFQSSLALRVEFVDNHGFYSVDELGIYLILMSTVTEVIWFRIDYSSFETKFKSLVVTKSFKMEVEISADTYLDWE